MKGYVVQSGFILCVKGREMLFASEEEAYEYQKEKENNENE